MTINFQQVNNNPFVIGQIGGTYSLGVSVGDIEELYELLGYTESQDMASQLILTAGFSLVGAIPEVVKSVKYRDDVRAAYTIATNITDDKFQQFNYSNRFEDLLIDETKAYNNAKGETLWGKIKSWFKSSKKATAPATVPTTPIAAVATGSKPANCPKTNMATEGVVHAALGITKENDGVKIGNGFDVAKKRNPSDNMKKITQKLAETASDDKNCKNTLSELSKIDNKAIEAKAANAAKAAKDATKAAASSSVKNIKNVSKSISKEAFGGLGILITAISGLSVELPSIVTAFKESSSEGWAQLGKSAATIAISDVGLSAAGQLAFGTLGFCLGGLIGPVGASILGAIGKMVGSSFGSIIGRKLSSWIFGKSATEKQQEDQLKEQAQATASSQVNLQSLLSEAKAQAAQETDANKAQQILAKVQLIENKLNTSTVPTTSNSTSNPFVFQ